MPKVPRCGSLPLLFHLQASSYLIESTTLYPPTAYCKDVIRHCSLHHLLPVPIVTGVTGPGRGGRHAVAEHGRAWDWVEVQPRIGGLRPVGPAVLVAVGLTEERADAVAAVTAEE
jgi:hypothetical protein